ncbi:eukaryotic translation initiation factor 2D isoform X1 [Ostrinia furnacalis]|uniref:eukaryotic translation initiation factor 2D isoform X1 n=1 Tax=Ostrinia furnacalis TaxID=93504 RepID=UPI00103F0393|nr:eukaryotic translation initiation factor 2D isoform X1 [Ostrinia furnacalis]
MFVKPYKLKSNNTLKNSEKKHLVQRIQDEFPGVPEGRVKELVPVKSNSSCMKLVLHSGDTVGVYVVDGFPMMIETSEALVPTVCTLWKIPEFLPTLIVHSPVLPKVAGGAPLYLPGVVRGALPRFRRGQLLAACSQDNAAAGLVGRATISVQDTQYMAAGVCLDAIQVFGDLLCKDTKFSKIERPKLGPASYPSSDVTEHLATDLSQLSVEPVKEEWPSLVKQPPAPAPAAHAPRIIEDTPANDIAPVDEPEDDLDDTALTESSQIEEDGIPSDMDGLLRWSLLSLLKLDGKQLELPLKTNLLYKNHLMPLCPPDRTLDVKKSSYKKMGKFLEAMQQEGLVEVREIDKGVDALVAVSLAHPALRAHAAPPRGPRPRAEPAEYTPPAIREVFCVTAHVTPLVPQHRKGTPLSAADVRTAVTEYVRARNLTGQQKNTVVLDATLAKILGKPEQAQMKWDEVMTGVQGKFTPGTEMRFSDGSQQLSKSRLEPVTMHVATRSGNKKVTLVSNLEAFGFSLPALAHVCQQGVAASCGVTRSPGAKHDQLMLQGDQTYFVAKLLIEKYGLPKKFVEGADKALKKKK